MCGATRESAPSAKSSEIHAGLSARPQAVSPPYSVSDSTHYQAAHEPSPVQSVPVPPVNTAELPAAEVPPASEPELFAQIYGRDKKKIEAEDIDEKSRKFDYRLIVVPVLLGLIVFLSYYQRRSAKDFFVMMKEIVAEQIAQFWPADKGHTRPVKQNEEPAKPVNVRKRVTTRQAQSPAIKVASVPVRPATPLRVNVAGQPAPQVAPAFARVAQPVPVHRSIAVGITGPTFSQTLPPSPMRVKIAPTESLSLLLQQIPPIYPAAARAAKVGGSVVLKAIIRKDGNVGELSVVSGHPMLVQAAMDAVRQWVYRPYYRNGEPTDVETLVIVDFSLSSDRAAVGGGH